jgi:hypothetical protein
MMTYLWENSRFVIVIFKLIENLNESVEPLRILSFHRIVEWVFVVEFVLSENYFAFHSESKYMLVSLYWCQMKTINPILEDWPLNFNIVFSLNCLSKFLEYDFKVFIIAFWFNSEKRFYTSKRIIWLWECCSEINAWTNSYHISFIFSCLLF